MEHLSASRLISFKECIGRWWHKNILKLEKKELTYSATVIGLTVHSLLEECCKMFLSGMKLKDAFRYINDSHAVKFNEILSKERETKTVWLKKGFNEKYELDMIKKWTKNILKLLERQNLRYAVQFWSEKRFEIQENDVMLTGIMDFLIQTKKGSLLITDFKTTSDIRKWLFVRYETDIQSLFYSYAVLKEFGVLPKSFSYLILSMHDRMLFLNSDNNKTSESEINERMKKHLRWYAKMKEVAGDTAYWSPSEKNCSFCLYVNDCERSVKKDDNFRKFLKLD